MIVVLGLLGFGMNVALFEMFVAFIGSLGVLYKLKCFVLCDFTIYSSFCCISAVGVNSSLRYANQSPNFNPVD